MNEAIWFSKFSWSSWMLCANFRVKCQNKEFFFTGTRGKKSRDKKQVLNFVSFIPEEVLSSNKAMWFSPNGKKLAFAYFDDSSTPIMNIPFYGYPGSLSFQYTSAIPIHYPKVKIPIVVSPWTKRILTINYRAVPFLFSCSLARHGEPERQALLRRSRSSCEGQRNAPRDRTSSGAFLFRENFGLCCISNWQSHSLDLDEPSSKQSLLHFLQPRSLELQNGMKISLANVSLNLHPVKFHSLTILSS